MDVTVLGMVTEVRLVQLWNELFPMLVRVLTSSNKTVIRPVQLWNAYVPMDVTVLGMVTEVKYPRARSANAPMLVTVYVKLVSILVTVDGISADTILEEADRIDAVIFVSLIVYSIPSIVILVNKYL